MTFIDFLVKFDFWILSFEGQLRFSQFILVTLSDLLDDDFANDNSSLLYYHKMIIILLHVVHKMSQSFLGVGFYLNNNSETEWLRNII